eukprot:gene10122-11156_t
MMMLPRPPLPYSNSNEGTEMRRSDCEIRINKGKLVELDKLHSENQREVVELDNLYAENQREIAAQARNKDVCANQLGFQGHKHNSSSFVSSMPYWEILAGKFERSEAERKYVYRSCIDDELAVGCWLSRHPKQRYESIARMFNLNRSGGSVCDRKSRAEEERMKNVEDWLQNSEQYSKKKMSDVSDKLSSIITCPPWMKTAVELRRTRMTTNTSMKEHTAICNSIKKPNFHAQPIGAISQQKTCHEVQVKRKSLIDNTCLQISSCSMNEVKQEESIATGENAIFLLQTLRNDGVDLSSFFKDANLKQRHVFVSCSFQRMDSTLADDSKRISGVVTYRKI